jgi:hypothetical protein
MLVDVEATADEAEQLSCAVLDRFRDVGLIAGTLTRECALGGEGYPPGPAIPDLYALEGDEGPFWQLITSGVEPRVGRDFNEWALGPVCEGFTCSTCRAEIEPFSDEMGDSVAKAVAAWIDQTGSILVTCPRCGSTRPITEWECKPPLGFGNLAFRFWNWPPLDLPSWKLDIVAIVREVTGHAMVRTHGHI